MVGVEPEDGTIVVYVNDPGVGRSIAAKHEGAYKGFPLKIEKASATAIVTAYADTR